MKGLTAEQQQLLAALLEQEGIEVEQEQGITRRADRASAPLSFAQQRLWFLDRLEPGNTAYNNCSAVRVMGNINVAALERALDEIVRRHEALRTRFKTTHDGTPVQVIAAHEPFTITHLDISGLEPSCREEEILRLITEESRRPFNLSEGPLLRVTMLLLSDEERVVLLTMHHIVSDGWAIKVFVQELGALYEAYSAGRPSPLPDLPIQYGDYAAWQRQYLQGEVLERQLSYWRHQLGGHLPALELPTDRVRPPVQSMRGARHLMELEPRLVEGLRGVAQREGVTLFMTLLAAFQVLLSRYSGQEDIMVGSPIAGRERAEIEGLIGLFINTLVMRTDLSGDPTFREALKRVREVALGAYAHQELPFEKLVEELQPERDMSRTPLFQVMFILQVPTQQKANSHGLTHKRIDFDLGSSKFDLTLFMQEDPFPEKPGAIGGFFEYNTDLFDASTIARMAGHWQQLLEAVAADPSRPISRLPLLTDAERHQLMVEWNATRAEYARDNCLHHLIEAQAARRPDATAVVYEGERLTYGELESRANQLAHYLRRRGVGPGVLVGLCVERSLGMVVALLGILKAGGAYVPLDPNYPQERLSYMLEDSEARVVVSERRLVEGLPASRAEVICLDADWPRIAEGSSERVEGGAGAEDLAYVIYTSGSTGKPKGVMIPHRAVVNFLESMRREPGLGPDDRLLAVTTLSFDIAGLELYLPLVVGAQVEVASREVAMDGAGLGRRLGEGGATVMQATPATWRMLLESGWGGDQRLRALCGGEALPRELADRLLERCGEVWNMYGPTETTIWSTTGRVEAGSSQAVTIGRPVANTEVYILDRQSQPVPVGVAGELHIGGAGLAKGYLNRPELTAEKFIPHPFSGEAGARLYKTGDLARYLAGGRIEVLGRLDHQVKVRGYRIELGEVEAALSEHVGVRQAVVVVREDEVGEKRLVAYIVGEVGAAPTASELRNYLKGRLPEYMVPQHFVVLGEMPLTPNGKVDRRALPAPDQARPELERTFIAPQTQVERTIASIWQQVLRVEKIGRNDNFFELGGHSLLLAQVHNRLCKALNIELPMTELFRYPTISTLAEFLSNREAAQPNFQHKQVRQRAGMRLEAMNRQRQFGREPSV